MSILAAPGAIDAPRLEFGAVVGRVFGTWFRSLPGFALVTALVYSPVVLWLLLPWLGILPPEIGGAIPRIPAVLLSLVVVHASAGAVTAGVAEALAGGRAGLGRMLGAAAARAPSYLPVAFVFVGVVSLGFVLLVVPGFLATFALAVSAPVAAAERPGILAALRRSAELTRGSRGVVFGVMLVANLTNSAVAKLGEVISRPFEATSPLLAWGAAQVAAAVGASLSAVMLAVLYHDLRAREGVDTAPLGAVFE